MKKLAIALVLLLNSSSFFEASAMFNPANIDGDEGQTAFFGAKIIADLTQELSPIVEFLDTNHPTQKQNVLLDIYHYLVTPNERVDGPISRILGTQGEAERESRIREVYAEDFQRTFTAAYGEEIPQGFEEHQGFSLSTLVGNIKGFYVDGLLTRSYEAEFEGQAIPEQRTYKQALAAYGHINVGNNRQLTTQVQEQLTSDILTRHMQALREAGATHDPSFQVLLSGSPEEYVMPQNPEGLRHRAIRVEDGDPDLQRVQRESLKEFQAQKARELQAALREIAAAEAREKAERTEKTRKEISEASKTGIYIAENLPTLMRAGSDLASLTGLALDPSSLNSAKVKLFSSLLHTTTSLLRAYVENSFLPMLNTVLFNAKQSTNLLRSENRAIQCGIDIATSTLSHAVTFNFMAAGVGAGLTTTKCLIKAYDEDSKLLPTIDIANGVFNVFTPSNLFIKGVEALKIAYLINDHF